jgi:hypothetical protein
MLLSDKLIAIGKAANAKNNLSMDNANRQMLSECQTALNNGSPFKQVNNIYVFAVNILNKAGFPYYKPEKFTL